jgi:hypothetical protein
VYDLVLMAAVACLTRARPSWEHASVAGLCAHHDWSNDYIHIRDDGWF